MTFNLCTPNNGDTHLYRKLLTWKGHRYLTVILAACLWLGAAPASAQVLTPSDPGFWVTLPNGGRVPYNHPLAAGVKTPAPAPAPAPRPETPAPLLRSRRLAPPAVDREISRLTVPNGSRVPHNNRIRATGVKTTGACRLLGSRKAHDSALPSPIQGPHAVRPGILGHAPERRHGSLQPSRRDCLQQGSPARGLSPPHHQPRSTLPHRNPRHHNPRRRPNRMPPAAR